MMHYQERLIELLDRRYSLVADASPQDFLLELDAFLDFIQSDEVLKYYVEQMVAQFQRRIQERDRAFEQQKREAIALRHRLVKIFPDLDDSKTPFELDPQFDLPSETYQRSLAHFDDIMNAINRWEGKIWPVSPDLYHDHSDVIKLLNILRRKLSLKERSLRQEGKDPSKEIPEDFRSDFDYLCDRHEHTHLDFVNHRRVSPGSSFAFLVDAVSKINPEPQKFGSWQQIIQTVSERALSSEGEAEDELRAIVYKGQENDRLLPVCKPHLRRVYESLRAMIGSRLIHWQILNRYKARCMWYDRERLLELVERNPTRRREDVLTRDLARYLFDNGISVLYRVRRGVHEFDLIGECSQAQIFLEVKTYKDSRNTRRTLVNGVAQLHAYLTGLEAHDTLVQEAYYVVYRLGGPLYDLPREIATNRLTIYPMTIDLGPSSESGRRQPRPIVLEPAEFFQTTKTE
jgi:hypothetical protein